MSAANSPVTADGRPQLGLAADCARCFGLCCVALPFAASADFAADKPAGKSCGNLGADHRCSIHARLRESGYPGCTVFDCFGAGQQVSQVTFAGRDWRTDPTAARGMFAVFPVMRQLHELLRYVTEAAALPAARPVRPQLLTARDELEHLIAGTPAQILAVDVADVRGRANTWLQRAGDLHRAQAPGGKGRNHRGADLLGARLNGRALRGACLRGARLIAAQLRGADLRFADLTGADLRDADLSGADLTDTAFLVPPQLAAAKGDRTTRLPAGFEAPAHWS